MATVTTTTAKSDLAGSTLVRIVARNTAFTLAGQILIKIFAFIFSIYVVRTLGAEHFGRYAAALAYVSIFAMLTDLGTSALSVREMARNKENIAWMVPDIMLLRGLLSLAAIGIITLSAWLFGKTSPEILGIFIASFVLLVYAFQGPLDSLMVSQERLDFSSVFKLLDKMTFMILGTILLVVGMGYIGLLIATLVGVLVMGIASQGVVQWVLRLRFTRPNPGRWWSLIKAGFPFGIKGAANEFTRRFDTVFMSFALTHEAVGWYNVPLNMLLTMMVMAQSLAMSIYPTMVREYDSGRGSIQGTVQRAMRYLLLLSLPAAIGGMLLADKIILVLYGEQFAPSIQVMRILVWALPFLFFAEMMGRTSNTLHLENQAARVSIINAVISIILNVILIPRLGATGAAIAMVATRLISNIQATFIIGPAMLFKGNVVPMLRVVLAGGVMGGIVWGLRDLPFLVTLGDTIGLFVLIMVGAIVYGIAALLLQAIRPGEAHYVYGTIRRKLTARPARHA
jgi:O-antigen/teichoic acid export membrane protein